jgi:hypothetical protein
MLGLILLWVAVYGGSSWTSAFITMLGAMFAVAATIGAVVGTWLGKRRGLSGQRLPEDQVVRSTGEESCPPRVICDVLTRSLMHVLRDALRRHFHA